ncbi:MAG: tail fiber protein [Dysgonamonadaceae bacterium]
MRQLYIFLFYFILCTILPFYEGFAQNIYTLGNTTNVKGWFKLGTLSLEQQGQDAVIRINGGIGYNASIDQNSEAVIHFRTSNTISVDNGFYGSGSFYQTGRNSVVKTLRIVQISTSIWDFYAYMDKFSGEGATLVFESASGTWNKNFEFVANPPSLGVIYKDIQEELVIQSPFFVGNQAYFPGGGIWSNSGNVGIGTTTPDQKLTVNGKIHAQEIIVDLNVPAADYVFSKDYSLMPLHQVETFVKENSHLPEIPSASELKEKGLSVGEMQNKLLQKIEELTLYVIEQDKRIRALESENKELKK